MNAPVFKCGHARTPENSRVAFGNRTACATCYTVRDTLIYGDTRERNAEMARLAREGMGMAGLVERFGLSRQQIGRILTLHDVAFEAPFATDPLFPQRALHVAADAVGHKPGAMSLANFNPRPVVRARWAFCVAMRERGATLPQIGRRLKRDHTTVIYGLRRAEDLIEIDPEFARLVEKVRAA